MLLLETLEFFNTVAKTFTVEKESETTTIENAEISLFENIRTELTELGERFHNYFALLKVRSKNSPNP